MGKEGERAKGGREGMVELASRSPSPSSRSLDDPLTRTARPSDSLLTRFASSFRACDRNSAETIRESRAAILARKDDGAQVSIRSGPERPPSSVHAKRIGGN